MPSNPVDEAREALVRDVDYGTMAAIQRSLDAYADAIREQERSRYEGLLAIVGAVARADNDDYIGEIKVDIPAGGYPRQSLLTAARAALGEEHTTDA